MVLADENDRALEPGPQELAPYPTATARGEAAPVRRAARDEATRGAAGGVTCRGDAAFCRARSPRPRLSAVPDRRVRDFRAASSAPPPPHSPVTGRCRHTKRRLPATRAPWARAPWARAHRPGTPAGHTGPATLARPLAVLELFAEPGIILSAIVPSGIAGAPPDQTRDRRCSTKRPLGASPGHPCPVRRGLRHGTKNLKPARPSTQKKATPLPALGITRRPCGVPLLLSLNLFIIELEIEELKVAGPGPSRKGGDPVRVHC